MIPTNEEWTRLANTFQIDRRDEEGVRILALDGYLDAHTAPEFEKAIEDEVADGHIRIVADCSRLTYISSAGLGVFMSFIEEIRERKGDIKIAAVQPKVFQVFDVLGFPILFDITETVAEARGKFGSAGERGV